MAAAVIYLSQGPLKKWTEHSICLYPYVDELKNPHILQEDKYFASNLYENAFLSASLGVQAQIREQMSGPEIS